MPVDIAILSILKEEYDAVLDCFDDHELWSGLVVGIAGGLPRDGLRKGDVVLADPIWGYEYGKVMADGFQPQGDLVFRPDQGLMSAAYGHPDPWK